MISEEGIISIGSDKAIFKKLGKELRKPLLGRLFHTTEGFLKAADFVGMCRSKARRQCHVNLFMQITM